MFPRGIGNLQTCWTSSDGKDWPLNLPQKCQNQIPGGLYSRVIYSQSEPLHRVCSHLPVQSKLTKGSLSRCIFVAWGWFWSLSLPFMHICIYERLHVCLYGHEWTSLTAAEFCGGRWRLSICSKFNFSDLEARKRIKLKLLTAVSYQLNPHSWALQMLCKARQEI